MLIRRYLIGLAALAALSAAPASAQNRAAEMAERQQAMVDTVAGQLELSEEQEKAFRAIMAEQAEGMRAVFEEYQGARDPKMRDDIMALQADADEELETVLSKEQMVKYVEIRDAYRAQFRRNRQQQQQQG